MTNGGRTALAGKPGGFTQEGFDSGQQAYNVMHGEAPARGDGVTPDQRAFLHWLDKANAVGGHRVYVPPATYALDAAIAATGYERIHIQGAGTGAILKPREYVAATGKATIALDFTDVTELVLEDLVIDGGAQVAPRLAWCRGSNPSGQKVVYIEPGYSIQAGDDVYLGNPEFRSTAYELNQVASIDGTVSTGATKITMVNNLANTYGGSTRIAQKANAYGGHGLRITNAERVVLRNVHFTNLLGNGLDVNQVDELVVDNCRFEGIGAAQVASAYYAATAFGIGGYDVSRARVTKSMFRNILGRRGAGIEVRSTVGAQSLVDPSDMTDWIIANNTFDTIGGQSDTFTSHGAGVNLVCGNNPVRIRRVVLEGNTSSNIGDGHFWIAMPGGLVSALGNTMEGSIYGPFLNINAPRASIVGNTMRTGGLSGIEIDAVSTGDYSLGNVLNTPGYLSLVGIEIIGNDISDLIHAQTGNGIVVTNQVGTLMSAADAPRQVIITGNRINGCWSDGIKLVNPLGDILIQGNIILDANQGTLASTTLTADTVSVNGYQQLAVASTAGFVPVQFIGMGSPTSAPVALASTTLLGATIVGATSFVVNSATDIAVGHALWLGTEEAATAEIVVPLTVVGTTITCAALTLAHANGVNVSSTYRPLLVSVDDATHMTVQYNQGVWAAGTAVGSPFPGNGGISISGSATFPAARIRIKDNRVGQDTVGTTQWGVFIGTGVPGPMTIADNDMDDCVQGKVRTVSGLDAYIDNPVAGQGGAGVHVKSATFAETANGDANPHTYTATINLPAESTILDIRIRTTTLWTATTSATMKVGDEFDDDGWFTGINLEGTDLLVGEEINFVQTGGKEGAYLSTATGLRLRAYANIAKTITGTITTVGATGNTGRSRMIVEYITTSPLAATKV